MPRHQENHRRDVLAGLRVDDAHEIVGQLAALGIPATVFSTRVIASDLFPSDDDHDAEVIVAPEHREQALRVLAGGGADAAGTDA